MNPQQGQSREREMPGHARAREGKAREDTPVGQLPWGLVTRFTRAVQEPSAASLF